MSDLKDYINKRKEADKEFLEQSDPGCFGSKISIIHLPLKRVISPDPNNPKDMKKVPDICGYRTKEQCNCLSGQWIEDKKVLFMKRNGLIMLQDIIFWVIVLYPGIVL